MPLKICGGVVVTLLIFSFSYFAFYLGGKLLDEATEFISGMITELEKDDNFIKKTADILKKLPEKFPVLKYFIGKDSKLSDEAYSFVRSASRDAVGKVSAGVTSVAADFIKSLPSFIFRAVVSILALYYFTVDRDRISATVTKLLPQRMVNPMKKLWECISGGVTSYVRAYFVLMLITFLTAFFGLAILKVRYAFFLAIVIAVVDALPILGAGSITLPWGIFCLIFGKTYRGVGLLILTAVMYLTRQITEPRLVGHFLGIHPLITLFTAYLGFSFFGLYGMILAPICLYVVRLTVNENEVSNDT